VVAAGVRHALDDEALIRAREASHVHLDAIDQAHAARPTVRSVRILDGFGEPARSCLKSLAANLVNG
jgi:hypothetical protein